ncbi:hypothetical protein NE237_032550 [Protea cynaroides]|uniref:Uncharacterized protein n=1 Tax=Protea cynaroides TaxID=273540 RepID=A0A9Q0L391_9MAGN|nr:hypothetical protein NE237_032550 [Protea cynaroides]
MKKVAGILEVKPQKLNSSSWGCFGVKSKALQTYLRSLQQVHEREAYNRWSPRESFNSLGY